MKGGRTSGFTLLELVVVVLILGAATAVIGACVAAGLRAYAEAQRFGASEVDMVLGLSLFERDVRNHKPCFRQPFVGESGRIVMVGLTASNTLARVTHWFQDNQWWREVAAWPMGGGALSAPEPISREVLLADVQDWKLTYYEAVTNGAWRIETEWQSRTNAPAPAAVELSFRFNASDGVKRRIERHVAMPVVWGP